MGCLSKDNRDDPGKKENKNIGSKNESDDQPEKTSKREPKTNDPQTDGSSSRNREKSPARDDQPITDWLNQWEDGDRIAAENLFKVALTELEKIARAHLIRQRPNLSLETGELINDAFLRLKNHKKKTDWLNRAHFFGITAKVMREIIIDKLRLKHALKRNRGKRDFTFEDQIAYMPSDASVDLVYLGHAVETLRKTQPEWAKVVFLKYFFGFTITECGDYLNISDRTVKRHWQKAKVWLQIYLRGREKFGFDQSDEALLDTDENLDEGPDERSPPSSKE